MTILTVNTGSSSVRLAAFTCDGDAEGSGERHAMIFLPASRPQGHARKFLETHGIGQIRAAAHRVVHGGSNLTASCLIDDKVEQEIDRLSPLAPLHNPVSLRWICATREVLGAAFPRLRYSTPHFLRLCRKSREHMQSRMSLPKSTALYATASMDWRIRPCGWDGVTV